MSAPLFGQTSAAIVVRVTDPRGQAVAGADVTVYSRDNALRISGTTDSDGACRLERLAPGEYLVSAAATGFARSSAQSARAERNTVTTVAISLPMAAASDEVVVVTASGGAQPVDEVSKSVSVVDRQAIDKRDELSIAEALRTVPGLRVQQLGGPGSFVTIKTRGLRNEDTAVLIDGLRFRDVAAPQGDATGFLADLIVTNVDRLEVLRGSGSSLYGTNAVGGVINIVTDEGGGKTRGGALLEGGSLGLFRGRGQIAGGFKQDRVYYSAALAHLNVIDGVDGDDPARITSGQGSASFRLTPAATLSARAYGADSFSKLNTSPQAIGTLPPRGIVNAVPLSLAELRRYEEGMQVSLLRVGQATFIPSANDPDSRRAAHFFSGTMTFAQRMSEAFGYTVSYHGLIGDRTLRNGPAGVSFQPSGNTQSDFDGRIHTLNGRASFRLGRLSFVDAGYEFESENFINRSFPSASADNSSVDVTQRSNTLFVQDQLRLFDERLQLSAAFRTQLFSLDRPRFTPSASAPYQGITFQAPPNAYTGDGSIAYFFRPTGTKIRGHAGNGYRAPSLYERFGTSFGSFGYSVYGDPRLRPDRAISFDAGVDQTLWNSRMRASATYFYTRLQEVIIFDFSGAITPQTDPFGRFGGYRNAGGALSRGLELSVTGAPAASLEVSAAYTYTNSLQRKPLVPDVIRSFAIPKQQFSVVATQRFGRRLFVNFDLTTWSENLAPIFDSRTFASRAYRFGAVAKADLGVSYRLPISDRRSIRFFGKVDNVFDRTYYELGFRVPGAAGVFGTHFEF